MLPASSDRLQDDLAGLNPADAQYATDVVERALDAGLDAGASDLHLQPTGDGLELWFRVDGLLRRVAEFPGELAANIVARLKVRAGLLTYQSDTPQEGRIRAGKGDNTAGDNTAGDVEMRVSTFPTLHGERAVVRFFGQDGRYERLDDLGLHDELLGPLAQLLGETSGAILVSGPAGSGKTTTVYACLREIFAQSQGQRSLVSIEDPIEVAVDGVAQSQVNSPVGLDLATGLRFLMRQDPEVIMVGEIRDRPTAEAALQASLTGHLMLSTFHAGSAAETVGRLLDMGIEPYVLRSGLLAVVCQRLLRRLCDCAKPSDDPDTRLGLPVERSAVPVGCDDCGGTGYRGRFLIAELCLPGNTDVGRAVLARSDTDTLERLAVEAGMVACRQRACRAVDAGRTSAAEVRRVLGFSESIRGQ